MGTGGQPVSCANAFTWIFGADEACSATAKETLDEYFKKIGGRPPKKEPEKKRKRKTEDVDTDTSKTTKGKKGKTATPELATSGKKKGSARNGQTEWKPPLGSWEDHIADIDTIEELVDSKTGQPERFAYVVWNNGNKSRHQLVTLNRQAPQKVRDMQP